jgi:hypothetical protein
MATAYFPILFPQANEGYSSDWPFDEVRFLKGYAQVTSQDYNIRRWGAQFMLLDTFKTGRMKAWSISTPFEVGDYVRPSDGGNYAHMCAIAGTSGGSEPDWAETEEQTTADGGVTWVCFLNNQITAVMNFIDRRKGRGGSSFYVWMPIISVWVRCRFPADGVKFTPVASGAYKAVYAEIEFEEFL